MAMKCCTKLETAKERCPIVFQGHPSSFKVTRDKTSPILTQIGRFRTIGRSQLSNPSDLPCFKLAHHEPILHIYSLIIKWSCIIIDYLSIMACNILGDLPVIVCNSKRYITYVYIHIYIYIIMWAQWYVFSNTLRFYSAIRAGSLEETNGLLSCRWHFSYSSCDLLQRGQPRLTNWGQTRWPPCYCRHFQAHFLEWEFLVFKQYSIEICSLWSNWQYARIGPNTALAPNRHLRLT